MAHFPCDPKTPHLVIAKGLVLAGHSLKEVLQIDLHGRPGTCVLTLSNAPLRDELVETGVVLDGNTVSVLPGDGSVAAVPVYVYGCEPTLHDGNICSVLGEFGSLVGEVQGESISHDGVKILTGVRRVSMV